MSGNDEVYQAVTDRMIAALEQGTVPWHKPWRASAGRPRSLSTGRAYQGVNVLLLGLTAAERGYSSRWWGTVRQVNELGGHIKKGQSRANGLGATHVTLWKTFTPKDAEADPRTGEVRQAVLGRLIPVFNAEQAEGLPERYYPQPGQEPETTESAEAVIAGYLTSPNAPTLDHDGGDRAFYRMAEDKIHLPLASSFDSADHYYATTFHELGHSTGHVSRLDRPGIADFDHHGSERYSREELVAELTAANLCAETGLDGEALFDNSANYIGSWLRELKDDKKLVVSAAAQAQKAADLVLEPTRQAEREDAEPQPAAVADAEAEAA